MSEGWENEVLRDLKHQFRELENGLESARSINKDLLEALKRITKREGKYSRDPLQFACNTIDSMEDIARAAIQRAKS